MPLGPDVEVGADTMIGALATLDEPKQWGLADQLHVKLVMDVEPAAKDDEWH